MLQSASLAARPMLPEHQTNEKLGDRSPHAYKKKASSFDTPSSLAGPLKMATERDPLLSASNTSLRAHDHSRSPVGPLEISRSTRYAILAGLWSATFLSVCVSQHESKTFLMSPPSVDSL
jgi:hypothetical protein